MPYNKSFIFEFIKSNSSNIFNTSPSYTFGNMNLYFDTDNCSSSWYSKSTENYFAFLDGNFYLNDSTTIDSAKNLDFLLSKIDQQNPEKVWESIQGGLYNIFLIDKKTKLLYINSDFLNSYPLFIYENEERLLISGNQFNFKSFSEYDQTSLIEFLKYGYLPFSDSVFKEITRKQPWENWEINLINSNIFKTENIPFNYNDTIDRETDLDKISDNIHKIFSRYFSRLSNKKILIGLSGGYDSRLLAAYLKQQNPKLLNFGFELSPETKLAGKIAEKLELEFHTESFPTDLLSKFGVELKENFRVIQSLEHSHVMHLHRKTPQFSCDFYVDGFIGDTVLGSSYFYSLKKTPRSLLKFLFGQNNSEHPILSENLYEDYFYDSKDCIKDNALGNLMAKGTKEAIKNKIRLSFNKNYLKAKTHEDMIESLNYIFRARNFIAGGPCGVSIFAQCACPFIDKEIFGLSLRIKKSLMIGNRLYNKIWRDHFPELAHFRKSGQGGSPRDADFAYRFKYLFYVIAKKMILPIIKIVTLGKFQGEEVYFSNEEYLKDKKNQEFFDSILLEARRVLPETINVYINKCKIDNKLDLTLYMRYLSLICYLKD